MEPGLERTATESTEVIFALIVTAVLYVAFFSWLAVIGWAKHRRMEREAYYRHDTEKRLLEQGEAGAKQIVRLRNEEDRSRWLRRREGLKLAGLVTTALGIGIFVFLQFVDIGNRSLGGTFGFPLIVGAVLLLYAYVLYPKLTELDVDSLPPPSDERRNDEQD